VKPATLAEVGEAAKSELAQHTAAFPQILTTSAQTGAGIDILRVEIAALAKPL
jgi:GTP-binding protein